MTVTMDEENEGGKTMVVKDASVFEVEDVHMLFFANHE